MNDLFVLIQQYLYEYIVDKEYINTTEQIINMYDHYIKGNEDYINLSFNTFQNFTLSASQEYLENQVKSSSLKKCTLSIRYTGDDAIKKLDTIRDNIRNNYNLGTDFLSKNKLSLTPINIMNISEVKSNSHIEVALLDVILYYIDCRFDNVKIDTIMKVDFNLD